LTFFWSSNVDTLATVTQGGVVTESRPANCRWRRAPRYVRIRDRVVTPKPVGNDSS